LNGEPLRIRRHALIRLELDDEFGQFEIEPVTVALTLMLRPAVLVGVGAFLVLAAALAESAACLSNRGSHDERGRTDSSASARTGTGARSAGMEAPVSATRQVLALLRTDAAVSQLERLQSQFAASAHPRPRC
jgi:hypothetical protein